jgi:16S rRNA (guanine527-N7)-methyltransferase
LLRRGLDELRLTLPEGAAERLTAWSAELLKWNEKVNLTAITRPDEVVDKHLLDSLAVVPEVEGAQHLLDLGAGAGLPGVPLLVALPGLQATLVDAVAKKVAFIKAGGVKAGVAARLKAVHARAEGAPETEGLPTVDLVIARAFMDVGRFTQLAVKYLTPGGRVVAMLGQVPPVAELEAVAAAAGLVVGSVRRFELPLSRDPRGVVVFHVKH